MEDLNVSPTPPITLISLITLLVLSFSLSALLYFQNLQLQKQVAKLSVQSTKIFCGGIAGVICPVGYTCQYDGNYPDASGTCVKEQQRGEGILKATIVRSPTCPGAITETDNCEGPAENATFYIIRLTGAELSERKTVTTDKNGQFSITLGPGTYKLQNSTSGIGKDISSPNFTITANNTTVQKFNIDTGIR